MKCLHQSDRRKQVFLWIFYTVLTIVVSLLKWGAGFNERGYTSYENYRIFRNSFLHLWQQVNIYGPFPAEQWDLFKYSPAFAFAMAPFSPLTDALGLCLWNLCNALPLLYALYILPFLTRRQSFLCGLLVLPELVISMQNSQSNGLTAAFLLLAWGAMERQRSLRAAGWIAAAAFIKIFGIVAALLFVLYPGKRYFVTGLFFWIVLLLALPFLFFSSDYVVQLYKWWAELLRGDHAASTGLSVQGWLLAWWHWSPSKSLITGAGAVALIACTGAVYLRNTPYARLLLWSSLFLWVVIFNHKAESPTFIIALCGAAVWYVVTPPSRSVHFLFWMVFVFSSLSPSDLFPPVLRKTFVEPFVLKALSCIVLWIILTFALLCRRNLFGNAPKE